MNPPGAEGHHAGADGAGALAGGECPTADGMRNSKKATSYFAKDVQFNLAQSIFLGLRHISAKDQFVKVLRHISE